MTQPKKPHVHAEFIKAWADGAEIEYQVEGDNHWWATDDPLWSPGASYRIKPEPIKTRPYRRWISKVNADAGFEYNLDTVSEGDYGVDVLHNHPFFVRWIDTEWQEGVVVDA